MKRLTAAIAAAALAVFLGVQAPLSARAEASSYDFARVGNESGAINVRSADLLSSILASPVSEAERSFLDRTEPVSFRYSGTVAVSNVLAEMEEETLRVRAREYSYDAVNGSTVVWRPVAMNGIPNGEGEWTLPLTDYTEDFVTVSYEAQFGFSAETVDLLKNAWRVAAEEAKGHIDAEESRYLAEMQKYEGDLAAREGYLSAKKKYDEELYPAYRKYVEDYGVWSRKNDDYNRYLEEYARYERELEEYERYDPVAAQQKYEAQLQAHREYLAGLDEYNRKYAEYLELLSSDEVRISREHLAALAYILTPAPNNQTLYGSIMGNTVTQVLTRKNELLQFDVDEQAIDLAGDATESLRRLFAQYDSRKTDAARYEFYITCHDQLRDSFKDLLQALDYLFTRGVVRKGIVALRGDEGLVKFRILLAQLYMIANALHDGTFYRYRSMNKFDSSYLIDGSTPASYLGEGVLADTENAAPLASGYPVCDPPDKPEEVPLPETPQRPSMPKEPEPVSSPGAAPEQVEEPTAPQFVAEPTAPVPYLPTEEETSLAGSLEAGEIPVREGGEGYTYTAKAEVIKNFRNLHEITVHFFGSTEDETPLFSTTVESGDRVEYAGPIPTKTREGYTCTFDGWTDETGRLVDLDALVSDRSDLLLYSHFTETPNSYPVVWNVAGRQISSEAAYGTLPVYPYGTPEREAEGARLFRFLNWDRPIAPIGTEGAEYTAVFEAGILIDWVVGGSRETVCVWKGDTPVYPHAEPVKASDEYWYYRFTGWEPTIAAAEEDTAYTARFEQLRLVVCEGSAKVQKTGEGYVADCTDAGYDESIGFSPLMLLANRDGCAVTVVRADCALYFSAGVVYDLVRADVAAFSVSVARSGADRYSYRTRFTDSAGEEVGGFTFRITLKGNYHPDRSRLYRIDGAGERAEVRFELSGGELSFTMHPNETYEILPEFHVNVIASEFVSVEADASLVSAGTVVRLTLGDLRAGMYLGELYVVDGEGKDVPLGGDHTFVMPSSDVTVGAVCLYIEYTVTFKAEGKVLSSAVYFYGSMPTPPADPVKASDGVHEYTFAGWGEEIVPVTEDKEYNAVFTETDLPEPPEPPTSVLEKVFIAVGVVLGAAGAGLVAAVAVLTVKLVRKKGEKSDAAPEKKEKEGKNPKNPPSVQ